MDNKYVIGIKESCAVLLTFCKYSQVRVTNGTKQPVT